MHLRRPDTRRLRPLSASGFALALTAALGLPAPARAQDATVLECNERVELTASPRFNPPVSGPLQYEWRDGTGRLLGTEPVLARAFPVGRLELTLRASASSGRTADAHLAIEVRDTLPPEVRTLVRSLDVGAATLAAGFDIFTAAAFSARDLCDPRPALRAEPPRPYGRGTTTVRLTATDAAGNTAAVPVTLTVTTTPSPSPGPGGTNAGPAPGTGPDSRDRQMPAAPAPSAGAGTGAGIGPGTRSLPDPGLPAAGTAPVPAPGSTTAFPTGSPTGTARESRIPAGDAPESSSISSLTVAMSLMAFGLMISALVLVARRKRPLPVTPPPATLRARASRPAAQHEIVLFDGFPQPRLDVRFRPRPEPGEPLVDAADEVVAIQVRE